MYNSLVTALYKVYVIWTFCCTGNKAFMKVYQWFYWTSNLQFWEKSQAIPWAPKQSWSSLQNVSWRSWWLQHCILNRLQNIYKFKMHNMLSILVLTRTFEVSYGSSYILRLPFHYTINVWLSYMFSDSVSMFGCHTCLVIVCQCLVVIHV